MPERPDVVVFEVLETLIDLDPLGAWLEEVGQPAALLGPWFMRFHRDATALTLAGCVPVSSRSPETYSCLPTSPVKASSRSRINWWRCTRSRRSVKERYSR